MWSSCSSPDSVVKLSKLSVTDPISIPGNVTISFDSVWGADIVAPLKVSLFIFIKIYLQSKLYFSLLFIILGCGFSTKKSCKSYFLQFMIKLMSIMITSLISCYCRLSSGWMCLASAMSALVPTTTSAQFFLTIKIGLAQSHLNPSSFLATAQEQR